MKLMKISFLIENGSLPLNHFSAQSVVKKERRKDSNKMSNTKTMIIFFEGIGKERIWFQTKRSKYLTFH